MYIILILLQFVKSKEIFNLEIDKSYKFYGEAPNSWLNYPVHQYKLEIPQDMENWDIFVILIPQNDIRIHPSLYILNDVYKLQTKECRSSNEIICKFPTDLRSKEQLIYFIAFCDISCYYELKVIKDSVDVYLSDLFMIGFKEEIYQKLIRVNLTNLEYERFQIRIFDIQLHENVKIYMSMNETIQPTEEFETYFQYNNNLNEIRICFWYNLSNPYYEMAMIIQSQGYLLLEKEIFQKIHSISLYEKLSDIIINDKINYYQLSIEDFKDKLLIFEILSINEILQIYVQPCIENRCKLDYSNFEWQFEFNQANNQFIIPPQKMVHTNVYVIAIKSNHYQYYEFVTKQTDNLRERIKTKSFFYRGFLQKNQIAQFLLQTSFHIEDTKINIQGNFAKGHGIMIDKQCIKDSEEIEILNPDDIFEYLQNADSNNYYNCSITKEKINIISQDVQEYQNILSLPYNQTESETNVTKFWFELNSFNYLYVIAIYCLADFMEFSIKIKSNSQVIKTQNLPSQQIISYTYLMEWKSDIYTAFVSGMNQQETIISIATYEGELDVINKKASKQQIISKNEFITSLDLHVMKPNNSEANSYTIQVQARIPSKYSYIETIINKSSTRISYINLVQAVPFKTLDLNLYYNFQVTEMAILYINLKSLQGNFICYILSSDKIIEDFSFNKSNISLTNTQQTIIFENPNWFYYLYVKSISNDENESYQIMYYYSTSFLDLYLGSTFYAMLNDQQKNYFYFQSLQNYQKLYIIRTYLSEYDQTNQLQIYISLKYQYPNQFNYQYQIQPNTNYVSIFNIESNQILYIGVYSNGFNQYSLLVQEMNSPIELKDNILQTSPTLEQHYYYFYYAIPKNYNDSIKIQAYTKFNLIEVFCNIIEFDIQYFQKERYPMPENYQIKELFSTSSSNKLLFINQNKLIKCKENGCLLLLSIYVLGNFDHFNIMVSTKYTVLRNMEMIIGYTNNNSMSYYYFDINEEIKVIQVTVRAIQTCDYQIYIQKFNLESQIVYPNADQYTYKFQSDTLEIFEENNIGQYMIGVEAQDCIYELLLHLGGFKLHYIQNGQHIDSVINDKVKYYYMNSHQQSFRILIYNIRNIIGSISIEEQDEIIELSNNNDLFGGVIQIDKNLCDSCTYILNLNPIRLTILSILLTYNNIAQQIEYGRIYYDYCLNNCEFNLQLGDLNLFVYSKSIQLTFYTKQLKEINKMNLGYSHNIIAINETSQLRIGKNSYYSIHLSNSDSVTVLQLGRVFMGKNTKEKNKIQFTFQIVGMDQDYAIQVSSQSDIMIDVYDVDSTRIIPKSELRMNKSNRRLIYQFNDIQQPYKIVLYCNDTYHLIMDVYNNENQIKYINFNSHYIEIIEDTQQYNIQTIVGEEIQFEILDCLGKSEMKRNSVASQREMFFKIKLRDRSEPFPFSILSLVPHLQYSHDQWYLRNQRLQVIELSNEQIEVNINTMRRRKTGNLNIKKLIYKLHISNRKELLRAMGCEIDIEFLQSYIGSSIFYNSSIQEVKEKEETVQFTVLKNRESIYGLLVFQVYYENKEIPYTYFYDVYLIYNASELSHMKSKEEVNNKEEDWKLDYILIVIGISLILAISLICLWICLPEQQQQQKRRELQEMQEQQTELVKFK
ncbi:unnamed protein product [Paramecium sonneborni]|uniref:Transmembrane protein n=1 Tax=Paramecium sonneborni TaxID=65129 RepID=A0A8S1RLT6_9CILI|nr:unnamed protein product [Paramecium sonneborni]